MFYFFYYLVSFMVKFDFNYDFTIYLYFFYIVEKLYELIKMLYTFGFTTFILSLLSLILFYIQPPFFFFC